MTFRAASGGFGRGVGRMSGGGVPFTFVPPTPTGNFIVAGAGNKLVAGSGNSLKAG